MPLDKDFNYKATAKRFTPIGVLFFKLCPFEVAPKICFNHHFLNPGKQTRAATQSNWRVGQGGPLVSEAVRPRGFNRKEKKEKG